MTRRQLLVASVSAGAAALVAACAGGRGASPRAAQVDEDVVRVDLALIALADLRAAYRQYLATAPKARPIVTPLLGHLQRHESDLLAARGRLAAGVPTISGTPRAVGKAGSIGGTTGLATAERRTAITCLNAARTAGHQEIARLLAQTAASHAQHATLLTRALR